jgi:RHS repeat-associated protein
VLRRAGRTNQWVRVGRVSYLYAGEVAQDSTAPLGQGANLVQVTKETLLNKSSESEANTYHREFTQYRYHDGDFATDCSTSDPRLGVRGLAGQLKMVVQPDQVEWAAQQRHVGRTPDQANLDETATYLLGLADCGDVAPYAGGSALAKLVDLSSKVVGYRSSDDRVSAQFLQSACGCSGGSGSQHGLKLTYEYVLWPLGGGSEPPGQSTVIAEHRLVSGTYESTPYRTSYHDLQYLGADRVPYTVFKAVRGSAISSTDMSPDAAIAERTLVLGYEYDSSTRLLVKELSSSNYTAYTPAVAGSSGNAPSATTDSAGLVHHYVYSTDNRLTEHRVASSASQSVSSSPLISRTIYGSGSGDTRTWLPATIRRFRTTLTTDPGSPSDDVEEVSYEYRFYSGTDAVSAVKTTMEREIQAENGPGGDVVTISAMSRAGKPTLEILEDGAVVTREFDSATGALIREVENANWSSVSVSSFDDLTELTAGLTIGRFTDGGSLTSEWTVDLLGRVVRSKVPGGTATSGAGPGIRSYSIRTLTPMPEGTSSTPAGIPFLAVRTFPERLPDGSYSGPQRVSWLSAGGVTLRSVTRRLAAVSTDEDYDPSVGRFTENTATNGGDLSRSWTARTSAGLVTSESRQWSLADSGAVYVTASSYDALGRLIRLVNPNGTITRNVYDPFDRLIATDVGTNDSGSNNMVRVQSRYHDLDWDSHSGSPTQGTGDGLLTWTREWVNSTDSRDHKRRYDVRNRLVHVIGPVSPHTVYTYDNQDRVLTEAQYLTAPTSTTLPSESHRGSYVARAYSQRGLEYISSVKIIPGDPSGGFLATNHWFDAAGRPIATWSPTSPGVKRSYDGLGRVVATYWTDRGGDAAPGASGTYAHAATLTDDHVFEQTLNTYAKHDQKWTGSLIGSTLTRRTHDLSGTGALSNSTSVNTFTGYLYDAVGRGTATIDFGTNESSDLLEIDGSAPTWPPASETPPSNTLFSTVTYNERGLVDIETDGLGQQTKHFYDDSGRRFATIGNFAASSSASWTLSSGLWSVSGLASTSSASSSVFDGLDRVTKLQAHHGSTSDVTTYIYGVSPSTSPPSDVTSNDLLLRVEYPDSTGTSDSERFGYNRLGERITFVDQRGTTHEYSRDSGGRLRHDVATAQGNSDVDYTVKRIERTYDGMGRLSDVVSHKNVDTSTADAFNGVRFTYTGLGQVGAIYQDHDSAVTVQTNGLPSGNTQRVLYTYADSDSTSGNFSRVASIMYPDNNAWAREYGGTSSPDSRVSRLVTIETPNTDDCVSYGYFGLGDFAYVDYCLADVQLDRTLRAPGDSNSWTRSYPTSPSGDEGKYPGFDRFGRVRHHTWVDYDIAPGSGGFPNQPPVFAERYTYDAVSNRKSRTDFRPTGSSHSASILPKDDFEYDALNRLEEMTRTVAANSNPAVGSQKWSLDQVGNWTTFNVSKNADHDYADSGVDFEDSRTPNGMNEMTARSLGLVGSTASATQTFDAAGNTTQIARNGAATQVDRYKYDAWNRVVLHQTAFYMLGSWAQSDVQSIQYNGLGWRTVLYTPGVIPPETRLCYYDADWRLIEEHVYIPSGLEFDDPSEPKVYIAQQLWGIRGVDDPVFRRIKLTNHEGEIPDSWGDLQVVEACDFYQLTDPLFSTVAIMEASPHAPALERVSYTPYGVGTHRFGADCNDDGVVTSADSGLVTNSAHNGSIGNEYYDVRVDVNRDGQVNSADGTLIGYQVGQVSPGLQEISSRTFGFAPGLPADSFTGFGGYVHTRTGRYLVRNRWYDPEGGRWMQRDPIGFEGGLNLYEYVAGSPASNVDPMGLSPWAAVVGYFDDLASGYVAYVEDQNGTTALKADTARHEEEARLAGLALKVEMLSQQAVTACEEERAARAAERLRVFTMMSRGDHSQIAEVNAVGHDVANYLHNEVLTNAAGGFGGISAGRGLGVAAAKFASTKLGQRAAARFAHSAAGRAWARANRPISELFEKRALSGAQRRVATYGHLWQRADLSKAINRHAGPNATSWRRGSKTIIENPKTGIQVVVDDAGYFRIFKPREFDSIDGDYLDMLGKIPAPARRVKSGAVKNLPGSRADMNQATHFWIR